MAWLSEDSKERASRDWAKVKGKQWLKDRGTKIKVKKRVLLLCRGTSSQAIQIYINVEGQIIVELFGKMTFG